MNCLIYLDSKHELCNEASLESTVRKLIKQSNGKERELVINSPKGIVLSADLIKELASADITIHFKLLRIEI